MEMSQSSLSSQTYEVPDTIEAIEFYYQQGLTDGLPVIPPRLPLRGDEEARLFLEGSRGRTGPAGCYPERGRYGGGGDQPRRLHRPRRRGQRWRILLQRDALGSGKLH